MLTVAQDEYRALYAAEKLLDNHRCAGIAEHTAEHLFQLFPGLFQSGKNQYAFTGAQTVGFQYVRGGKSIKKGKAFFQCIGGYAFVAGGRNVVAQHELFGKLLAAFQLCTFCGGADNGDVLRGGISFEVIENALYQRVFRTHHNHVNFLLKGKSLEGGEVRSLYLYVLAYCVCARIAGSDVQFFYFGALCNLPSQSVFAAT